MFATDLQTLELDMERGWSNGQAGLGGQPDHDDVLSD
jgi:hypothetical protein